MPGPIATFVIPCCNGAEHLTATVRSILAQDRQDFELVLVDDASTDGSVAAAAAIAGARLRIVQHASRIGLAANFAHAASIVTTPYFCIAHQDDVYEPAYLSTMARALDEDPTRAIAHCSARAIDAAGNPIAAAAERFKLRLAHRARAADPAGVFRLLLRGNFVCCPSVLFRASAFRAIGGFDTGLSFALDWELWLRLARAGARFGTILEPLVRYRRHLGNATREATTSLKRFEEEFSVLRAAQERGLADGLIDPSTAIDMALRNNLVNESFEDLLAGNVSGYRAKMAFLDARLPRLRRDPYVIALRALARAGSPGIAALSMLRRFAVRLGLG